MIWNQIGTIGVKELDIINGVVEYKSKPYSRERKHPEEDDPEIAPE